MNIQSVLAAVNNEESFNQSQEKLANNPWAPNVVVWNEMVSKEQEAIEYEVTLNFRTCCT
jgi:hypothetical protein